ncbi:MAG: hypothetical protein U1D06_09985 [Paracoccaceae bacterium]|nr:hypothetical protein [Paracoccaceae bacterium]
MQCICKFCDTRAKSPADTGTGTGTGAGATNPKPATALAAGIGRPGRKTLIKGGSVLSMDAQVGNFARGDMLIEGKKILQIAADIDAPDAAVIDAAGHVVMPKH